MNERVYALSLTVCLSILLSIVQISLDSRTSLTRSYFTSQVAFYIAIMIFGNIMSTLLAEAIVENVDIQQNVFRGPRWFWYSAIGVFGFEAIIQKLNITLFDKGILSLNDWITKAKAIAVAATLEKAVNISIDDEQDLAKKLYATLNGTELHTLLLNILGSDVYGRALGSIVSSPQINKELHLATIAAGLSPKKVKGVLKSYKKKK